MNDDNFYSIERLVEFGLGMNIARQMVGSMNQAMQNVSIPGPHNLPVAASSHYFLVLDGQQAGPFSEAEVCRLIHEGRLTKDSLAWKAGMQTWLPIQNVPDVLRLVALTPPPLSQKGS